MNLVALLVIGLATWRFSSLLANDKEEGPFDVLGKFRHFVGVRYTKLSPDNMKTEAYGANGFARMILCTWCNSVWIGIIITVAFILLPSVTLMACLPFALSTIAIVIDRVIA